MSLLYILVGCIIESISPGIQLVVIPVEEDADGCSTSEPVSKATLCDYVTEGVQAYAEQQWAQNISLVDWTADAPSIQIIRTFQILFVKKCLNNVEFPLYLTIVCHFVLVFPIEFQ